MHLFRAIAVGCLALVPAAAAGAARLSPQEIQAAFFTGKPFTASTPSNIKFTMLFLADGRVTREPVGKPEHIVIRSGLAEVSASPGAIPESRCRLPL